MTEVVGLMHHSYSFFAPAFNVSCGPHAEAKIGVIGPVHLVMPAAAAGPSVVGDFVSGTACRFGQFLGGFIEARRQIVVRDAQLAIAM